MFLLSQITSVQKEIVLRQLAYKMHSDGKGELSRGELEGAVATIAADLGLPIPAADILEDIERRSGLLVERSIDVLGFSHLTLQEYLVAKHVQNNQDLANRLDTYADNQEWREVILLYAGLVEDASDLIRRIRRDGSSIARTILAGHCAGESGRVDQTVVREVVDALIQALMVSGRVVESEAVLGALSAVATDYQGEAPGTRQQILSAELIDWIPLGGERSTYAIVALGRARITRELPVVVETMIMSESLRDVATKAIISLGNLSLDTLLKAAAAASGSVQVEVFLAPLFAIGTGSAVSTLMRLYALYTAPADQSNISWHIAVLLNNPLVRAELFEIAETDLTAPISEQQLPGRGPSYLHADESIHPSPGFLKLAEKLIHDLASVIRSDMRPNVISSPHENEKPYFNILFPATVQAIRESNDPVPEETLAWLGFDAKLASEQGSSTDNLCRAIQTEGANMRSIMTRGTRSRSKVGSLKRKVGTGQYGCLPALVFPFSILLF